MKPEWLLALEELEAYATAAGQPHYAHVGHATLLRWLLANHARIRGEYQRFYDFVAEADQSLVDAWHFTENARKTAPPE